MSTFLAIIYLPRSSDEKNKHVNTNLLSHRGAMGIAGAYGEFDEEGQEDAMLQDTASRQCPIISLDFIPPPASSNDSDRVDEAETPPPVTGAAVRKGWASAALSTGALTPEGDFVSSGGLNAGGDICGGAVEGSRTAGSTLVVGTPSCCLCLSMVTKQVGACDVNKKHLAARRFVTGDSI